MSSLLDVYATRDDEEEENDGDYSSEEERQPSNKKRPREVENREGGDDGEDDDDDEDEDSSEEEDDDEEEARKIAEGFIVEDEDEDAEEDGEVRPRKKKRRLHRSRQRSESPVLDEEDLDLLNENLGKPRRRSPASQKFKRIRRGRTESPTRQRGVEDIFSDEERDEDADLGPPRGEFDDFIEDDEPESEEDDLLKEARKIQRERMKAQQRTTYLPNEAGIDADAMEEITQLFGDGLEYEFAMEPSDDEEPEVDEEGEERIKEVQLKDIFEPSELKERLLTDADELIRITDEPERFQLYRPAQTPPLEIDIERESTWIADRLLAREYKRRVDPELEDAFRQSITHILSFFNTDSLEVPFIWQHRRDFLYYPDRELDETTGNVVLKALRVLVDQDDLWKVWEEDGKYRAIQQRLASLKTVWESLEQSDRVVEECLTEINSVEDVQDLHDYIYFTYSEQIRDQQLLQNGANGHSTGYKRAAGNKLAIWEKIRKGPVYHLVKGFGISASDFGTNVKEGARRYWTEDPSISPEEMAKEFQEGSGTAEMALAAAKQMFTEELFHDPNVRRYFRELLIGNKSQPGRAGYSVRPTERGLKKIDDTHPYYHFKYLTNQRISQVPLNPDRFLQIMAAEREGLVTVEIVIPNLQECVKQLVELINSDNFSEVAMAWNKLREEVLSDALARIFPFSMKLVKESLRVDCEDILATICRQNFSQKLDRAPWQAEELEKGQTPAVLAISCSSGDFSRDAIVCAFVDDTGRLIEQIQLPDVREVENKRALGDFIERRSPDVIGLAGFSVQTYRLHDDIVNMMKERSEVTRQVLYVNDEVARLYQNSKRGTEEFPDLGTLTRYCIALARYLQNPLMEYIAMGRDVVSIPVHKNQNLIGEEKLYRALESAMVDIVNMCGIDINEAVRDPYIALALPFIAGLGPRKTQSVVKKINNVGGYLENRAELITKQIVSKNIFMNCASFLRIHGSGKDADPLDSTRVHPEDYDLAKKMAGDALELDEEDVVMLEREGGVVKQLMDDDTEKLNDLILEEYADQLAKVFNQLKRNTLEQIKDELQGPYEELRRDFKPLTIEEVFTMLTGETEESLHENMIVPVNIRRVGDRYTSAFLDCGVEGNIPQNEMHDDPMMLGSQLFQPNQTVNAVILTLERSSFTAELSTKQSRIDEARRLAKMHPEINPDEWDDYAEERDRNRVAAKREAENRSTRVIKHPLFRSFNSKQAEEFLSGMQRGDVVIRPSSLGPDHIAVTWKVAEGVYQHIDVLELDKANEFSVGRQLRVGRKYTYSDLDELIVSHIKSMARKVDEMTTHEKFQRGSRADTEQWLTSYSEANPRRSAYAFCINKEHPGCFDLCFKTSPKAPVKSWPVKVVPGAFLLMDNIYGDMNALSNGFKRLFTAQLKDQRRR